MEFIAGAVIIYFVFKLLDWCFAKKTKIINGQYYIVRAVPRHAPVDATTNVVKLRVVK